jgi:hypothetical protein
MPFTTPKTWTTNEVVTAANMNTHLRDNMAFVGSPPSCSVFNSGPQSVPNASFTAMTANSERWDTDGMHSTVSNTARITATTAGRYTFNTTMTFTANATGARAIGYAVNGGATVQVQAHDNAGGSVNSVLSASFDLVLAATDFVEVQAWQPSGGNLNITLDSYSARLVSVP